MTAAARYAALEASRTARDPRDLTAPVALPAPPRPEPRGTWSVVRQFDDGRSEPIRLNMTEGDAAKLAGELRDRMSDEDRAKGFQILPRNGSTGFKFKTPEQRSAVLKKPGSRRGRGRMAGYR